MIKETLQAIDGVATYPVVVLVLFVVAFLGVVLWTWQLDRDLMTKLERLPLDATESNIGQEDMCHD
ncbi:MAG: CcoQ/FixQ family Cbb3-type cytochrome c oxidase assembly chaperone [bacterium]